ncbi:hypothetical protein [Roseibium suaedae]|uniref:Flagellar protein FlgN n=1 Tax=Roseibium suaedae TaxID=735517 RepID=A0A1M7IBQ4_9HYPH|nr:hypothetical protein [Roseibium suaedae]SHM38023.1 hypothetical protein SAMN05444272_2488 [Roseibium suaedae]
MQISLSSATIAKIDSSILHMISVADELISVTSEESRRLQEEAQPAIDDLLARKRELIHDYENWIKLFRTQKNVLLQASPMLFEELLERNRELSVCLAENNKHLEKAMTSNRRRVDTIMQVIREERKPPAVYGGNGQYKDRPAAPVSLRPVREA